MERKRKRKRECDKFCECQRCDKWIFHVLCWPDRSHLICSLSLLFFSAECFADHKWPASALNEHGLLIAVRRHPGSHEICAGTHDHRDNSPGPDHGFSLSTLSHPGLEWLMSGTDGKTRPLYVLAEQGEGQCLMGDIRANKMCHPTSLIALLLWLGSCGWG